MRSAIGQQCADRAFFIQWGAAAMQVAQAYFKGTLVLGRRAQALPLRRFKHYGGYAVGAPLGHEGLDCPPVVLSALLDTWQASEPGRIPRAHSKLGSWVLRWIVHHLNMWEGLKTKTMNARETASPEASAMATLLVRTDTGVFRLHLGEGAAEVAASLGNGHCFQVLPVFALPLAPKGIPDSVAAYVVESGGTSLGNGWFAGVALDMLAAFMVRACIADGSHQASAPEQHQLPPAVEAVGSSAAVAPSTPLATSTCANASNSPAGSVAPPVVLADDEHVSGEDEHVSEDVDEGVVDEIWLHVEGARIADADKAVDIRSALENRLGRQEAKRLLVCTRATVAKQNGHKNRILRIGRIALKLRRDSPCAPVL